MLDKVERFRTYEAIVEKVQRLIDAGRLSPGDKLPPERELAEMLGTSRATVREACRVLEHKGLIESRIGSGRFVCARRPPLNPSSDNLASAAEEKRIPDFVELRKILEIPMVEMAARKATPEDVNRLRHAVSMWNDPISESLVADMQFHLAIADASGNSLLVDLLNSELFLMYRLLSLTTSLPGRVDEVIREHTRILEAIQAHDSVEAMRLMRQHLELNERALGVILRRNRETMPSTAAPESQGRVETAVSAWPEALDPNARRSNLDTIDSGLSP